MPSTPASDPSDLESTAPEGGQLVRRVGVVVRDLPVTNDDVMREDAAHRFVEAAADRLVTNRERGGMCRCVRRCGELQARASIAVAAEDATLTDSVAAEFALPSAALREELAPAAAHARSDRPGSRS
jgi:hypothetical protein